MNVVADHFADCAEILKNAGYDMVLIHGGHGWLLDQFLSPYTTPAPTNTADRWRTGPSSP